MRAYFGAVLSCLAISCTGGADPSVGRARAFALPESCDEIGAPANQHSCTHAELGPFANVNAVPPAAPLPPNINAPHTHFTITLPSADGSDQFLGVAVYRSVETGPYAFYLSRPVPLRLIDEGTGADVPVALAHAIADCPGDLDLARVYELSGGGRYRVEIGPDPMASAAVVVENLDALSAFYYADADRDGHGDVRDETPFLTWCAPPEGRAGEADDCDDENSAVNPSATEICNGLDDDCDGNVDMAEGLLCSDAGPHEPDASSGDDGGGGDSADDSSGDDTSGDDSSGDGGGGGCGVAAAAGPESLAGADARSAATGWSQLAVFFAALLCFRVETRKRKRRKRKQRRPGVGRGAAPAFLVFVLAALSGLAACSDDDPAGASPDAAPPLDAGVEPPPDAGLPPQLTDDRAVTARDVRVHIRVLANDGDPESLEIAEVGPPAHGSASVAEGVVTYAPEPGWSGEDSFTYRARVGGRGEAGATVTVEVASWFGTVVEGVLYQAVAERPADSASGLRWLGVNDGGDLVGALDDQAVLRSAGGDLEAIALPGAAVSFAYAINTPGDVVGELNDGVDAFGFEIIGGVTAIGTDPVVIPHGIADDGTVVGVDARSDPLVGWYRPPGQEASTVAREGLATAFHDVGSGGAIVGDEFGAEGGRCFVRDADGVIAPLAPLDGVAAQAIHDCSGIDDAGHVVGSVGMVVGESLPFVAVRWTNGAPRRVHFPFPPESGATYRAEQLSDVNNEGWMVGWYYEEVLTRDPAGRFYGVVLTPVEPAPHTSYDQDTPYDHVPGF